MRLLSLGRLFGMMAIIGGLSIGLATAAFADPDQGSIARGGKLYDKWYKVIKAPEPTEPHPLYPAANKKYAADAASNWRCKECHGWDGLGAAGAYAEGGHATGIIGINGKIGADPAEIAALLKADAHGYGDKMTDADLMDIANFVSYGQIDWTPYVANKAIQGNAEAGGQIYRTACIGCHGAEGKLPTGMPPLGSLAGNPWEVMHKVMNGQPGEAMPALRAFGPQAAADVVAYISTLPAQ